MVDVDDYYEDVLGSGDLKMMITMDDSSSPPVCKEVDKIRPGNFL